MEFYQVFENDHDYMVPHLDPDEVEDKRGDDDFVMITKPRTYSEGWVPLELEFKMGGSLPTIPTVSRWRNYLVLHESAYKQLKALLEPHGEFLPCTHQGSTLYLFNTLTIAEDLEAIQPGSVTRNGNLLSAIQFVETKLKGIPLFRTKESFVSVYCTDAFKKAVEDAVLEGLMFSSNLTHY
ncbi:MAG: hypothetical protein CSH37_05420 [Thalassolituus sp.]|jgi:hypothetical protein|nr:MAG: hypothetical protein CSH37_05420 [Thalassolituus sp.]